MDKCEFYVNSENDTDGCVAIGYWEDDAATGPSFYFFKDGLIAEKYWSLFITLWLIFIL